jgi:hypothetical protein
MSEGEEIYGGEHTISRKKFNSGSVRLSTRVGMCLVAGRDIFSREVHGHNAQGRALKGTAKKLSEAEQADRYFDVEMAVFEAKQDLCDIVIRIVARTAKVSRVEAKKILFGFQAFHELMNSDDTSHASAGSIVADDIPKNWKIDGKRVPLQPLRYMMKVMEVGGMPLMDVRMREWKDFHLSSPGCSLHAKYERGGLPTKNEITARSRDLSEQSARHRAAKAALAAHTALNANIAPAVR